MAKLVCSSVAGVAGEFTSRKTFGCFLVLLGAICSTICLLRDRWHPKALDHLQGFSPDVWAVDHVDPQAFKDAEVQKLDATSRSFFSVAMSSYKTPQQQLTNTVHDQNVLEKAFARLDFAVKTAKDVERTCLDKLFEEFLDSLSNKTFVVVLHVACHGEEKGGHLALKLTDGTDFHLDDLPERTLRQIGEAIVTDGSCEGCWCYGPLGCLLPA